MKMIFEILEEVAKKRTKAEKISFLQKNESWALKDVIRGSVDSTIKFNLPEGRPPYTANREESAPTSLLRENKKFGYFVKGGPGDDLPSYKRESIFLGILEGIHPKDAEVLVDMINKVTPKGLTRPIIEEAFPGLLKD